MRPGHLAEFAAAIRHLQKSRGLPVRLVLPLIPVLQYTIQIARNEFTTLPGMPLHRQNRSVTRLNFMPHLARLPVPEAHITATITGANELPIRADCHVRRIARNIVAAVALFAILAEAVGRGVDGDLVIGGLKSHVFTRGMRGGANHGEHVGFCNKLDGDWDTVFPCPERFVV